jgi:hypothetical protein
LIITPNASFHIKYLDTLLRTGQTCHIQEAQQFAHVTIQFHRMEPLIRAFYKNSFPLKYWALFQADDDAATTIACWFRRWQRRKKRFVNFLIDKYDLTHPFGCPIPSKSPVSSSRRRRRRKSPANCDKFSPTRTSQSQRAIYTNYQSRQVRSSSPKARSNPLKPLKSLSKLSASLTMETEADTSQQYHTTMNPIETAQQEDIIDYWELAHAKSPEKLTPVEVPPAFIAMDEEQDNDRLESKRKTTLLDIYEQEAASILDKRSPEKQSIVTPSKDQLDLKEIESFLRFASYRSQVITQRFVPLNQLNKTTVKPKWLHQLEALEEFVQTEQNQCQRRKSDTTGIIDSTKTKGSNTSNNSYLTKIQQRVIFRLEKLSLTYTQLFGDTSDFLNAIQTLLQELDTWKCHDLPKSLRELKEIGMKEEKVRNLEFLHVFQ